MPLNYLCILQIARIIPFYLYYPRGKLNFRMNFEKHIILRVTYLGVFSSHLVKSSFYPFICSLPSLTCVVIHSMSLYWVILWAYYHTKLHEIWTSNQQISHSNYILIGERNPGPASISESWITMQNLFYSWWQTLEEVSEDSGKKRWAAWNKSLV